MTGVSNRERAADLPEVYESVLLDGWQDFAQAALDNPIYPAAWRTLGLRRGAFAAILDCYFRSLPGDGRRLESDHEYFCSRVSSLTRHLTPVTGPSVGRLAIAKRMKALRRQSGQGSDLARLMLLVIRISSSWETALAAHDAYREFRNRVAPQLPVAPPPLVYSVV